MVMSIKVFPIVHTHITNLKQRPGFMLISRKHSASSRSSFGTEMTVRYLYTQLKCLLYFQFGLSLKR